MLLARYSIACARLQPWELRQRAVTEQYVVKFAQIEIIAQRFLGAVAQLPDLQLPELVGQGLAGPGDIAVHFGPDVAARQRGVAGEVFHRLCAAPALGMDAGIDHQPARAPHFVTQPTKVFIRAAVYAHLDTEFLGIQTPAFAKGADVQVTPKIGHVFQLLRQRPLVVMARHRFVQGQRGQFVKRSLIERIGVDPVGAADGAADRWADISRGRVIRRHFVRHRHDPVGQARQLAKKAGHQVIDALGRIGRFLEQLF